MTVRRSKSDIVAHVLEAMPHLPAKTAVDAVNATLNAIRHHAHDSDMVVLTNFGTFTKRYRREATTRNPRTGESVSVAAKRVPYFKTGKQLREKLNN